MKNIRTLYGSRWILGFVMVMSLLAISPELVAQGDTWEAKAPMPTAQVAPVAGAIDGKLYLAGGNPASCTSSSALSVYDPATDSWSGAAPMPAGRHSAGAAVIDGKFYVAGGSSSPCFDPAQSTLFRYDPVNDTWSTLASSAAARVNLRLEVIDGKLYALGDGNFGGPNFEMYDPGTDAWTAKASFPTGTISGAAVGVIGGKLYVGGGLSSCCTSLSSLWIYDPVTDNWTSGTPLPSGRNLAVGGVIDNTLYVAGGLDAGGAASTDTLFAYNPGTNSWTTKSSMILARYYHAGAILGGKFYVVGGSGPSASMEAYTPVDAGQAIQTLAATVQSFNLKQGIANSLDAKIQNAFDALSAANAGNRSDAANKLGAFINSVNSQRGKQLTNVQADTLVALATQIIAGL